MSKPPAATAEKIVIVRDGIGFSTSGGEDISPNLHIVVKGRGVGIQIIKKTAAVEKKKLSKRIHKEKSKADRAPRAVDAKPGAIVIHDHRCGRDDISYVHDSDEATTPMPYEIVNDFKDDRAETLIVDHPGAPPRKLRRTESDLVQRATVITNKF